MKKLTSILLVIVAIIGFVVGYLIIQNKVTIKADKDNYKFDEKVTFSVRNLTLGIIKYEPCWKGIDVQRKIDGEWTDLNIMEIEECTETKKIEVIPLISNIFSFKIEPGNLGEGTMLRKRVEKAVELIAEGNYRIYFEYFDKNYSKTRAYSKAFKVE